MKCVYCLMKQVKYVEVPNALTVKLGRREKPDLSTGEFQAELFGTVFLPCCEDHNEIPVVVDFVVAEKVNSEPGLYEDPVDLFRNPLSYEEAKLIKILRLPMECSFARIGELYEQQGLRPTNLSGCVGDDGRMLCVWAAERLNENAEGPGWEC